MQFRAYALGVVVFFCAPFALLAQQNQTVWSENATINLGSAFTPPYYGGGGTGAWQFIIAGYTNWPGVNGTGQVVNAAETTNPGTWLGESGPRVTAWSPPAAGTYQFAIRKLASDGWNSSNIAHWYTVTVNGAPTVSISDPVYTIKLGESVALSTSANDAQGNLVGHSFWRRGPRAVDNFGGDWNDWTRDYDNMAGWNVSNPGQPTGGGSSNKSGSYTPSAAGYYQFHANAWDAGGMWGNGATTHSVFVVPKPSASTSASATNGTSAGGGGSVFVHLGNTISVSSSASAAGWLSEHAILRYTGTSSPSGLAGVAGGHIAASSGTQSSTISGSWAPTAAGTYTLYSEAFTGRSGGERLDGTSGYPGYFDGGGDKRITITVGRSPTGSLQLLDTNKNAIAMTNGKWALPLGRQFYVRINGSDADANLDQFYVRLNYPDGGQAYWTNQTRDAGDAANGRRDYGPFTADRVGDWAVWGHVADTNARGWGSVSPWDGNANGWATFGQYPITVSNQAPNSVSINVTPTTIVYGESFQMTAVMTDPDGNLTKHALWVNPPAADGSQQWAPNIRPLNSAGFNSPEWTDGWSGGPWNNGFAMGGSSSTIGATFVPNRLGVWGFHTNGLDVGGLGGPNGGDTKWVTVVPRAKMRLWLEYFAPNSDTAGQSGQTDKGNFWPSEYDNTPDRGTLNAHFYALGNTIRLRRVLNMPNGQATACRIVVTDPDGAEILNNTANVSPSATDQWVVVDNVISLSKLGAYTVRLTGWANLTTPNPGEATVTYRINVGNRAPDTVSITVTPSSIKFGESFQMTGTLTDPDANLTKHALWLIPPTANGWEPYLRPTNAAGVNGLEWTGGGWSGGPWNNGFAMGGASSTVGATFTPNQLGTWAFHTNGSDLAGAGGPGGGDTKWVTVVPRAKMQLWLEYFAPYSDTAGQSGQTDKGNFWPSDYDNTPDRGTLNAHTFAIGNTVRLRRVLSMPDGYGTGVRIIVTDPDGTEILNQTADINPTSSAQLIAHDNVISLAKLGIYTVRLTGWANLTTPNPGEASVTYRINVINRAPDSVSVTVNATTITYGESVQFTGTLTDLDGNLTKHALYVNPPAADGSPQWNPHIRPVNSAGFNSPEWTDGWSGGPWNNGFATDGYRSVVGGTFKPNRAGTWGIHTNGLDITGAGGPGGGDTKWITVNKAANTITFNTPADRLTGDPAFNPGATASSGLPVSYTILSGPAQISGSLVSLTGQAGTVVVRATQGGNENYIAAAPVDRSFKVYVADADEDGDGVSNVKERAQGTSMHVYQTGTSGLGQTVPAGWPKLVEASTTRTGEVGTTSGELSVGPSGAASYSVPIWVTPGTAGMEPKLTLNYSSQGGAGIAGFGWSLGGLSAITRGPQTLAVDGQIRGVTIAASDRFYLDGQRLIAINGGAYGADGTEYRTEMESFTRVISYGTRGSGPEKFKAWTKAGLIIEFGYTADSAFDASGKTEALSWHVNKISDTSGNYISFTYSEDAANGTHLLSQIDYTGNSGAGVATYASVVFAYEDRSDWSSGYLAGSPVANLKRLKSIASKFQTTTVRTYTLNYTERGPSKRSLLTSLAESGTTPEVYPGLTFEYSDSAPGWEFTSTWKPGSNYIPPYLLADNTTEKSTGSGFVDLNGDGLPDLVFKKEGGSSGAYLNNGSGWTSTSSYVLPWQLASSAGDDTGGRFVDFDGDGRVDYVWRKHGSGGELQSSGARRNTGNGWADASTWTPPAPLARDSYPYHGGQFLDVNGDGRVDLVAPLGSSGGAGVYLNTGSGWAWNSSYSAQPYDLAYYRVRYVDLNGDGLPDRVVRYHGNNETRNDAWLNTGSGWQSTPSYCAPQLLGDNVNGSIGAEFADVNGDGLPDLIWYRESGSTHSKGVAINMGTGWLVPAVGSEIYNRYTPPAPLSRDGESSSGVVVMDLNADGLPDISMNRQFSGQSPAIMMHYGDLHQWAPTDDVTNKAVPVPLLEPGVKASGVDFIDLDGDGAIDIVQRRKNSNGIEVSGAWHNKSKPADRLFRVTNGFGVKAELTYKPLTDASVYVKGTALDNEVDFVEAERPDVVNVISPMYVVSQVRHDDGAGGTYNLDYGYGKLRAHRIRGSLGFGWMSVLDTRTQIRSTSEFAQTFPFTGTAVATSTKWEKAANDIRELSWSETTLAEKTYHGGTTHLPFALTVEQGGNDLDGTTPVSYTKTTSRGLNANNQLVDFDEYGNALFVQVESGAGYVKTSRSEYANTVSTDKWHLGRLTSSTVTATAPGTPAITRKSSFTYDPITGLLASETVEPDRGSETVHNESPALSANLKVETHYEYDAFGNKTKVTVKGGGLSADRVTTTTYDPADVPDTHSPATRVNGRFPLRTTNASGHSETYGYIAFWGVVERLIGPNELETWWMVDGYGRKIREIRADGTVTETRYRWAGSGAPSGSLYLIETEATGAPPSVAFHDAFGRAIYAYGLNGGLLDGNARIVGTRTEYDSKGRAFRSSLPFYFGNTPETAVETTVYDLLDRPKTVLTRHETGFVTATYSYDGLTTRASVATGPETVQRTDSTRNLAGMTVSTVSNAMAAANSVERGAVSYAYDAMGNLTTTSVRKQDGTWVTTTLTYDVRGRKIEMNDPDMGVWKYAYNAVGELVWQKDAKGQVTRMDYDALGRLTSRTEPGVDTTGAAITVTTTWTYDTLIRTGTTPATIRFWLGKLAAVSTTAERGKSYSESYSYDSLGRPSTVLRTIDGVGYSTIQEYDSIGRPSITTYPSLFKVKNVYNTFGFLTEVRAAGGLTTWSNEVGANHLFWKADSYSVWGQVDGSVLGNGLSYDRAINKYTGRVEVLTAGVGTGTTVQYHQYTYDTLGNVLSRVDAAVNRSESFAYDGLNRLTSHTVSGGTTVTVGYDSLGNITSKTDIAGSTYTYGSSRPHAVTAAGGNSYAYDANGNMINRAGQVIEWTSFNQIRKINTSGTPNTEFWFGAARERVLQKHSNNTLTTYVGSLYEKVVHPNGLVEEKHYVMTPLGRTAVRTVRNSASVETRYLHQDNLGSIVAVTTESGAVEKRFTYDAWGKRVATIDTYSKTPGGKMTRGYTGHEHLEDFGLIHMNGRVYDPGLARFLSADPFVDDAGDSQSYNRYSYVSNNPLKYTDPSGYSKWWKKALIIVAAVVVGVVTAGAALWALPTALGGTATFGAGISAALSGAVGGFSTLAAAVTAGAGFGFGSAFAGSLLNGGSIGDAFKAGLIGGAIGAVTGAAFHGINKVLPDWYSGQIPGEHDQWFTAERVGRQFARTGARGVVSGAGTEAAGGDFEKGFGFSVAFDSIKFASEAAVEWRYRWEAKNIPGKQFNADVLSRHAHTLDTAKGNADWKLPGESLVDPTHPNVGIPISDPKAFAWTKEDSWFLGGLAKNVPGMNNLGVYHDYWATSVQVRNAGFWGRMAGFATSQSTIPPILVADYTLLLSEARINYGAIQRPD